MSSQKKPKKARSTANHVNRTSHGIDLSCPLGLFSSSADQFALLVVSVDKHCLRIFDVSDCSLIAEHSIDTARVSSICWLSLTLKEDEIVSNPSTPARPQKRKKSASKTASLESNRTQLVGLGLTDGSLLLYSPKHARVLRVLSHPTSSSAVLAITPGKKPFHLWCSTSNGFLYIWNVARNELLNNYKSDDAGYTSLTLFPNEDEDGDEDFNLLVANHVIKVLTMPPSANLQLEGDHKLKEKMAFTGHITSVKSLHHDNLRLLSHAEGDRKPLASASLDASVRQITTHSGKLLALSASDKVSLFELPATVPGDQISALTPSSTISRDPKANNEDISVIAVAFISNSDSESHVRIACLKSGARPIFEDVHYSEKSGKYIPQIFLLKNTSDLATTATSTLGVKKQRYTENSQLAAGAGTEIAEEADILAKEIDGDLDVDLAELSLGQRLTALSGAELDGRGADSDNDKADTGRRTRTSRSGKTKNDEERLAIPSQSLSRTLVQALHSADTRLLELCLRHSDESVILNTVKRLPPQLAVPLLMACVERLGRGARAGTAHGGGAGASAQRGTGLVRWIRAVLIVHTAHLVTMPDLVTKLAGLHATITARLALRDPLLALSGRVDLILSQMELRSNGITSTLRPEKRKEGRHSKAPYRYVEGETETENESEEKMEGHVDVEEGDDDEGSMEDVELGGESNESEGSGDEDSELEGVHGEEDEEDEEKFNGFIDDEADEASSEENEP
ncbi:hypothetical protein Clacol_003793 [Clathrus columnatus]|uniref:Small-subunit processome Utp12 domain-containing protein n=1 Tax=Clathrus columnatus TaxID=1419009 RepID=A0AAV5A5K2_9AGAM|nr:hypothetical protein Clacol_003793 [Clathrus columnatus]